MAGEDSNMAGGVPEDRRWESDPVLSVEHLTMRFGGLVAVNELSFDVGRGDITALIGPNGAGKTTVFNCVTGFYKPTEGRIVMRHGNGRHEELVEQVTRSSRQFAEEEDGAVFLLERMPDFVISDKARVARTFQNIRLFGGMTALENLLVAQHNMLMNASLYTLGGIFGIPSFKRARQRAIELATYWLEQVSLIDRADDPAADLPYGAQRRLEIARAMCTKPQLLCLDEPAAGLNPRESHQLNELLQFIRAEHDTSVLLIEHDMGVVMEISDHVIVLDYGEKISDGSAQEVRTDAKVIAAYLGVEDEDEIDIPDVREDMKPKGDAPAPEAEAATAPKQDTAGAAPKTSPGKKPRALKKARSGGADNLTRISGIGPASEKKLNEAGIFHFDQIAAWDEEQVEWVDRYLAFSGRVEREEWVKQAQTLASGQETDFSKRVEKGKVPTSRRSKPKNGKRGGKA